MNRFNVECFLDKLIILEHDEVPGILVKYFYLPKEIVIRKSQYCSNKLIAKVYKTSDNYYAHEIWINRGENKHIDFQKYTNWYLLLKELDNDYPFHFAYLSSEHIDKIINYRNFHSKQKEITSKYNLSLKLIELINILSHYPYSKKLYFRNNQNYKILISDLTISFCTMKNEIETLKNKISESKDEDYLLLKWIIKIIQKEIKLHENMTKEEYKKIVNNYNNDINNKDYFEVNIQKYIDDYQILQNAINNFR